MRDELFANLLNRILDDDAYCVERLGRIPDKAEVDTVILEGDFVDRAQDIVSVALDPLEGELWVALGGEA